MTDNSANQQVNQQATVPTQLSGHRFDQIAAKLFPEFSRERLKRWIIDGSLRVNHHQQKPSDRLYGEETLQLTAILQDQQEWQAKQQPINILYDDASIIVVNKPIDCVVHPAAGHQNDTLVNALLYQYPELQTLPRAGIVHRLDKDTSGVMVVARNLQAHHSLVEQLQNRSMSRRYQAVVCGHPLQQGIINTLIGRHPTQRKQMAVTSDGKLAITHYKVLQYFKGFSLLELKLETGRTHQIRVHMQHCGFPIVGDPTYNKGKKPNQIATSPLKTFLSDFKRQALHAISLTLTHPSTGQPVNFQSPIADDIQTLLEQLNQYNSSQTTQ